MPFDWKILSLWIRSGRMKDAMWQSDTKSYENNIKCAMQCKDMIIGAAKGKMHKR